MEENGIQTSGQQASSVLNEENVRRFKSMFRTEEEYKEKISVLYALRLAAHKPLEGLSPEERKRKASYPIFKLTNELIDALWIEGLHPRYNGEAVVWDDLRKQ